MVDVWLSLFICFSNYIKKQIQIYRVGPHSWFLYTLKKLSYVGWYSVGGIMVSIAAFQAVDPGSIPGRRIFIQHFLITIYNLSVSSCAPACWLVGLGVWFSLRVREVPGSNPGRALTFNLVIKVILLKVGPGEIRTRDLLFTRQAL